MNLTSEMVSDIVTATFEQVAQTQVVPQSDPIQLHGNATYVAGCVQYILGSWHAATLIQMPMTLARHVSGMMFEGKPDVDISIAEVRDAIGEVTNIVAGNLRKAMPDGAHMSLPTVVDGVGYSFEIIDAKLQVDLAFEFQGEAFRLSIWTNGSTGT